MPESIDTSLVRIHTKAGGVAGAGFLVGERHILTCAHVIAQALGLADDAPDQPSSTISLDFPQLALHTLLSARVVSWSPVQEDGRGDIAALELLDKPPAGAEAAHFALAEQVWDHPFRALGFPSGYDDGVFATGRLLGRQGTNWIQIEDVKVPGFAVIAGFSGAPVWDEQLQGIVGMIVAASQQATAKAAFVIPYDVLVEAWPELANIIRPPVPRNPYKGLHAFTEYDARDFFGRDTLINELATAVEAALTRESKEGQQARMLTIVLGPSGSGKSSVVRAGLLPYLHDGRVLNSKEWVYLDPVLPGAHPLEALGLTLAAQVPDRPFRFVREDLEGNATRGLHVLTMQLVKQPETRVVLLVDQFEEVFTLTTDEAERQHFFELLVTAATEPRGPLFVILTLRADFYDRPMQYPELFRLIDDHHVSVLPLEVDDLRKVIEQPANLPDVQVIFENGLVDELLMDMQGQSGALPLLEFTLDQLFQRRNGYRLTLQAYHEMGGVKGALSKHAEETYLGLPSDAHRQAARDIFLRLIEPGTTEQDTTRRRADRSEFERADPMQAQQMQETLEAFIRERLLTTNQVGDKTTVEVSHEALIRVWKRLAEWLHEARDDIRFQQSLSENVEEWEQRKRPRDRLYRGAQLKETQKWASRNRPSEQEAAFLRASAAQRIRAVVSLVAILCLLVLSMGVAVWYVLHQPPDPTRVTNMDDDGTGSLRWALATAKAGSKITFAPDVTGAIKLTSAELDIYKNMEIIGPGTNVLSIVGGENSHRVTIEPHISVTLSDLTITSFNMNGITNYGNLTLNNVRIVHNTSPGNGGGIENWNGGTLTLINSVVSRNSAASDGTEFGHNPDFGNGGGIANHGSVTLINSIVMGNTASVHGGGIASRDQGSVTVSHSLIAGNTACEAGGGLFSSSGTIKFIDSTISDNKVISCARHTIAGNGEGIIGDGGGIESYGRLQPTNFTLIDSTVSGNKAPASGGGISDVSTLIQRDITFCTIYGNAAHIGGGIAIEHPPNNIRGPGRMTMSNSIVAGNHADTGPDISGILTTDGYNLVQNFSGATFLDPLKKHSTDISGEKFPGLGIDPTLRNNDGLTKTHALLTGSPAIDAIPLQYCQVQGILNSRSRVYTDQRDMKRPDGNESSCDIGAYEYLDSPT